MQSQLDAYDRRILALLQEDASLSSAQIAERVGLSQSPCWRRIQRLKEEGVIRGQVTLLDRKKIGLNTQIFAEVKLNAHGRSNLTEFAEAMRDFPEVLECLLITGQPYGRGPRQSLDIWVPENAQADDRLPVIIFFYGGGWDSGSRDLYGWAAQALALGDVVHVQRQNHRPTDSLQLQNQAQDQTQISGVRDADHHVGRRLAGQSPQDGVARDLLVRAAGAQASVGGASGKSRTFRGVGCQPFSGRAPCYRRRGSAAAPMLSSPGPCRAAYGRAVYYQMSSSPMPWTHTGRAGSFLISNHDLRLVPGGRLRQQERSAS